MQDLLDRKHPLICANDDDDDDEDEDDDGYVPGNSNSNFNKATSEDPLSINTLHTSTWITTAYQYAENYYGVTVVAQRTQMPTPPTIVDWELTEPP